MQRRPLVLTALSVPAAALLVAAPVAALGDPAESPPPSPGERHEVTLQNAGGDDVGTVTLEDVPGGVRVTAALSGLTPGFHGFHVHDIGVCDPAAPDGPFTSAGGHYVGGGSEHGDHDGDLPSLYVRADGSADLSSVTDRFTLDELLAGDGVAVMVHQGRDNFANIPDRYTSSLNGETGPDPTTESTGDAGARAACGVLRAEPVVEAGAGLVTVPAAGSVAETVSLITTAVEAAGLQVVATVDHAAVAQQAGQQLRPTTLLLVGNPARDIPLLQGAQTAGIDLPQKLLVWEDAEGQVHVTYNDPDYIAARHGLTGQDQALHALSLTVEDLVVEAVQTRP